MLWLFICLLGITSASMGALVAREAIKRKWNPNKTFAIIALITIPIVMGFTAIFKMASDLGMFN